MDLSRNKELKLLSFINEKTKPPTTKINNNV